MEARAVREMSPLHKILHDVGQDSPHSQMNRWIRLWVDNWFDLPDESPAPKPTSLFVKIVKMDLEWIKADVGHNDVLVGTLVCVTRDNEWRVTVTVARTGFNQYRATYTSSHPGQ